MAVNVSGSIGLRASISDARTAVSGAANETGSRTTSLDVSWQIATGTAAGLADKVWSDTRSVASNTTDSIDLAGALTDSFGVIVTFARVKAILFYAATTNTTTLSIQRIATAGAPLFLADADGLAPLSAGGGFAWFDPAAGFTPIATTDDIVSVVNTAGAAAIYTIIVVGTSA